MKERSAKKQKFDPMDITIAICEGRNSIVKLIIENGFSLNQLYKEMGLSWGCIDSKTGYYVYGQHRYVVLDDANEEERSEKQKEMVIEEEEVEEESDEDDLNSDYEIDVDLERNINEYVCNCVGRHEQSEEEEDTYGCKCLGNLKNAKEEECICTPYGEYIPWSPLHYATYLQKPHSIKILLENGANQHLKDKMEITPYHIAVKYQNEKVEIAYLMFEMMQRYIIIFNKMNDSTFDFQ